MTLKSFSLPVITHSAPDCVRPDPAQSCQEAVDVAIPRSFLEDWDKSLRKIQMDQFKIIYSEQHLKKLQAPNIG